MLSNSQEKRTHMTHIEPKNNRVMWPERDTGRKAEWEIRSSGSAVELSTASGENDACDSPAKTQDVMGKACFQSATTLTDTHTHPGTDMHTYAHLHICSHLLSVLQDACWVHTHNKARISTIKLSTGNEAKPHSTVSKQPTCSDKKLD